MTSILLRLGLVLTGTNLDLVPPTKDDGDEGGGPSDESEEQEDESESGGGGSDEEEEEGSSSPEGSEEDEDEEEDSEEGDGVPGSSGSSEESEGEEGSESEDGEDEDYEDESDEDGEDEDYEDDSEDDSEDGEDDSEGKTDSKDSSDSEMSGDGAGGWDEGDDESTIAESLLEAMEQGAKTDLLDNNQALGEAIEGEVADDEPLEQDEDPWRPYNPEADQIKVPNATPVSREVALRMRVTVKEGVSFLRNKLRSKFLQARTPQTIHGVRNGRDLSERRMVSSFVELKAGRRPERPDWQRVDREECSLACAIVLDQSGSMCDLVAAVGQAAMAVAEPLDTLGSPCLVVGPRNGGRDYARNYESMSSEELWGEPRLDENGVPLKDRWGSPICARRFHRSESVIIDVFKGWDEPFNRCFDRFGRLQAVGSTPLEDGIQYALQELSGRKERHRVVLVVTDGAPDTPSVVRRQIRLAAHAGVHVVGVGISQGCGQVKYLFPEHVSVYDVRDLPKELLAVLEGIMFPKHGKRVELDGKFKKRTSIRD